MKRVRSKKGDMQKFITETQKHENYKYLIIQYSMQVEHAI
jgi:hypothetical protein